MSAFSSRGRRSAKLRRDKAGTTTIEFAIVALAFTMMLFVSMDLARYYGTSQSLNIIAGATLRGAIADTSLSGCTTPLTRVHSLVPLLDTSKTTLCVTRGTSSGLATLSITASYSFSFITPLLGALNRTISTSTAANY